MRPPARSKRLHNFSLPFLKWGNQKFLRCVKVGDGNHHHNQYSSPIIPIVFQSKPTKTSPQKSKSINQNLKSSPKKPSNINNSNEVPPVFEEKKGEDFSQSVVRPWNLRTRRAACNAPDKERKPAYFAAALESPKRCNNNNNNIGRVSLVNRVVNNNNDNKSQQNLEINGEEKVKFSVSLMKEEIEADFAKMVGIRPPRRPKKRPRIVQRQLDSLFPGLWLTEVTPDSYKVPEVVE